MSTIEIGIHGSNANYSINVDKMRDRLGQMHNRLSKAIEDKGGNAPELAKRLETIEDQIKRLEKLEGKDVKLTPAAAKRELENGMKLLGEGMKFLQNNSAGTSQAMGKLESWFDHVSGVRRRFDTRA